ncbi:hypothetical protein GCM10009564_47660 [Streptomyces thermogriseus]|uniref:Uncharacterized protein n=1 Tax=Streptomyces thermogriseus TaxID=75292 RepID=A0ABN1T4X4_9ACTN
MGAMAAAAGATDTDAAGMDAAATDAAGMDAAATDAAATDAADVADTADAADADDQCPLVTRSGADRRPMAPVRFVGMCCGACCRRTRTPMPWSPRPRRCRHV